MVKTLRLNMLDKLDNEHHQIDKFYDILITEESDVQGAKFIEAALEDDYQPITTAQTL